jgi:hypothetical protein
MRVFSKCRASFYKPFKINDLGVIAEAADGKSAENRGFLSSDGDRYAGLPSTLSPSY